MPFPLGLRGLRPLLGRVLLALLAAQRVHAGPSGPVVWGATVAVASGGWGRMVELANGNWLAVSTVFPPGTNTSLALYRSADSCRTWSLLSQVAEPGRTLDNGELVVLPGGGLLLTMRSLVAGVSYRLPVYRSANGGLDWSYLSNIDTSEGLGFRGLWEPDFWVLADGRLAVTYSNEKHDGFSQIISEKVSGDNGATWGPELQIVAQPGGGGLRPGMSQMARMADGRYLLVFEVVNSGNADVHCQFSADGIHWPAGLGTRIPCQHCGPFVAALPDGRLFVTSCGNEVSFSEDFGETWRKIDPPARETGFKFTWPAVYSIRTNEIGVLAVSPSLRLRFGALAPPAVWPNPFAADFADGNDAGWTRYGGNVSFAAGRYQLANSGTYGKSLTGDAFWTDGTLEADVWISTATGDAGLLFRVTNPDHTGPDDAFGYYVGLNPGGRVVLGRMADSWTPLASAPASVPLDTPLHLRIEIGGTTFRVFVNREPQPRITWSDATFRRGQIGVRAFQTDARFDNVTYSNAVPLRLDLQRSGAALDFTWPRSAFQTLRLQEAGALSALAAAWSPVTNPPALADERWRLSLPAGSNDRYFRLGTP